MANKNTFLFMILAIVVQLWLFADVRAGELQATTDASGQAMNANSIEKYLSTLNEESVEVEQAGGDEARKYFEKLLSDHLIFRRATGKVVGKAEFIEGLKKSSPFSSRSSGIVSVTPLNDRALVTLIVVATRADDGSVHHYRNIRLFSRSGQDWLMELWYNYEITGL